MFRRLFVFTSVCVSVLVSFASLVGGVDEVSFLSFKGSPEGKILEELKRVDVFILLDGTASMRPYIHEAHRVAKAIVATFSNTSSPKESYARFGFRVYRGDYAGKNDIGENLVLPPDCNPNQKAKAIRANQDRFKQKLSKVMASTEDEKIHAPYLENLFHGLRQAVDDMAGCPEHTKLLFVIGDAGDKDLPIPDDVIQKLRSFLKPMTLFFIRTPNNEQNAYTPRAYREAYKRFEDQALTILNKVLPATTPDKQLHLMELRDPALVEDILKRVRVVAQVFSVPTTPASITASATPAASVPGTSASTPEENVVSEGLQVADRVPLSSAQQNSAPSPSPNPSEIKPSAVAPRSPEEQELIKARTANEEAQAAYYRKQTERIAQRPPDKALWERFMQSVADNPASVLGVVGALAALCGALFAARVAFLSFFFNYYATLKNQADTQFYEALKRFGDKDSPAIRASATGMLEVMGQMEMSRFDHREPTFFKRLSLLRTVEQPYLSLAIDQLCAGLVLEQNRVVLSAIKSALLRLIALDQERALDRLYKANLALQEDLMTALAAYFAIQGGSRWADIADITELVWTRAVVLTSFKSTELHNLSRKFDTKQGAYWGKEKALRPPKEFTNVLQKAQQSFESIPDEKRSEHITTVTSHLELSAIRLHMNADLLCAVLGNKDPAQLSLDDIFLPSD